jgi:hypothetical protein
MSRHGRSPIADSRPSNVLWRGTLFAQACCGRGSGARCEGGTAMANAQEQAQEAYCVKCKQKREVQDGHVETLDNGRRALKGVCGVCGTKLTRFLPAEK